MESGLPFAIDGRSEERWKDGQSPGEKNDTNDVGDTTRRWRSRPTARAERHDLCPEQPLNGTNGVRRGKHNDPIARLES